jgi:hypothetical protein
VKSKSNETVYYVAVRREIRNACNILVWIPGGMNPLKDLDTDVRLI